MSTPYSAPSRTISDDLLTPSFSTMVPSTSTRAALEESTPHTVQLTDGEHDLILQFRQCKADAARLRAASTFPLERPGYALAAIDGLPGPYVNSSVEASTTLMSMQYLHIPVPDWEWCTKLNIAVQEFHSTIANSHNYEHIQRCCAIALRLYEAEKAAGRAESIDPRKLFISMMVHDVGDSKYCPDRTTGEAMTKDLLTQCGCPSSLIDDIWTIADGVSFSQEVKDPEKVRRLIMKHPELAFVQDADRIDGLGAVGIGRCFAYGGAAEGLRYHSLNRAPQMIFRRFIAYLGFMKTPAGRTEACARWPEMERFWRVYEREVDVSNVLLSEESREDCLT